MTSVILKSAGSIIGGAAAGPFGSVLGSSLGQVAGTILSGSSGRTAKFEGPRLADLSVQTSTYGKMIPLTFGTVRIAGNILWSRPIAEHVTTTTSGGGGGGKGGGGGARTRTTDYSYTVSLAIGVCEGEVTDILRVWADAKQLDLALGTYRIYKGTETQLPDTYIESFEGVGATPAYRGLAYVVIEDFPLGDFGNRIPNFTFEVKRKLLAADISGDPIEDRISEVMMIPGAGEFVYDTQVDYKVPGEQAGSNWAQNGARVAMNQHTPFGKSNALVALDQLQETLPNANWVGVVVSWFGDTMNAGTCVLKPGVEYSVGATTAPEVWSVAGFNRSTARTITLEGSTPRYGGTPDDESLLRYLDALIARGYSIYFVPMFFMDVSGKPWRGELTGSSADVASFFTKTHGYNAFVTHYANLVASRVDAFAIGSELVGLTKVTSSAGVYPGVSALVSLAATVKSIVGSPVKVTYAADWSEYHHTDGGWYNLDPLWASSNIDMVGIDAYFPLTNAPQHAIELQDIVDGWTSGEGYDFYYTDSSRTTTASLSAPYAWKNIGWWWNNTHTNPGGGATAWVPTSKPIWFTEYGFPSVDGATNQPNVFYDPYASSSAFPYFSKGRVDTRAQRLALIAAETVWGGSSMVQKKFLWTWDARPYPYWPDLTNVWTDGAAWKTGHWVQGKLGLSSLAAIVAELCARAGFSDVAIDVSRLGAVVDGFVITSQQSIRASLEQLMAGFFFDGVERAGTLAFIPRGDNASHPIDEKDLIALASGDARTMLATTRAQELELPQRVNVIYLNREANYQPSTQLSQRTATMSEEALTLNLPIVFPDQVAKTVADITLYNGWVGRVEYSFQLPVKYSALEPSDILSLTVQGITHTMRIASIQFGAGLLKVKAVAEELSTYDFYLHAASITPVLAETQPVGTTRLEFLDIPALPQEDVNAASVRFAAAGLEAGWRGAVLYRSDDAGSNYAALTSFTTRATIGTAVNALGNGVTHSFDEINSLIVTLLGEAELSSATELAVLNGANLAVLGDELIQFQNAVLLAPNKYSLARLLRGRLGTEWATGSHVAGDRFVVLDSAVVKDISGHALLGLPRLYKPVTAGATLAETASQNFTYAGRAFKPYAPVHVAGARDGSGNLTLTWVRRARGSSDWNNFVDVPLNETTEAYEVDILNGSSVIRTISSLASPAASYSAAQQVTDFGAAQSSVSVRIYQLSSVVGRGYAANAVV